MRSALRSGSFVTRERMLAYSILLLLGYISAIIALLATADGIVDWSGRPLGTDFANVYAAGKLAREGQPGLAYDWPAHHAVQKDVAQRADVPYYGWHYPPAFLLVAALLAALPYLGALFVYQVTTFAAYLGVVGRIVGRYEAKLTCLVALAFPATFINMGHGHNGFLSAALLGGALLLLDRRPWLAGALAGCLAYKPQFGLLIPLVLMATGRWRVFFASALTVVAICGATWFVFGGEPFMAFWHSLAMTQLVISEGAPGFHKIQSFYAAVRLLGAPAGIANAVQLVASIGVAVGIVALWRSPAAYELKAAGLLIGSLLTTPYVLDYDLVVLAPAIAFMTVHGIRHGFAPYEITSLMALWALPLAARSVADLTTVSLGPMVMLAALSLILYRAAILGALGTITATHAR